MWSLVNYVFLSFGYVVFFFFFYIFYFVSECLCELFDFHDSVDTNAAAPAFFRTESMAKELLGVAAAIYTSSAIGLLLATVSSPSLIKYISRQTVGGSSFHH